MKHIQSIGRRLRESVGKIADLRSQSCNLLVTDHANDGVVLLVGEYTILRQEGSYIPTTDLLNELLYLEDGSGKYVCNIYEMWYESTAEYNTRVLHESFCQIWYLELAPTEC